MEIVSVILSCLAFEEEISKPGFFHVDNTSAQSALINAGSSNHSSSSLLYFFLDMDIEQRLQFRPWISRVSSFLNIADGPSRGSFAEVEHLGALCFEFPAEVFDYILDEFKCKKSRYHTKY